MPIVTTALQLILRHEPLPLLSIRTAIQSLQLYPPLGVRFIPELLQHLVNRQVWTLPKLWIGFLKCVEMDTPHSLPVLISLPQEALIDALQKQPSLREPLMCYAASHLSTVPPPALDVLGLAEEEETLDI
uniref:Symplekin C-terminal domain-containing protein n=1 Tax=Haptolina brevifila TaxID=156173 RepID=A0A7S2B7D7_9EUKA